MFRPSPALIPVKWVAISISLGPDEADTGTLSQVKKNTAKQKRHL